MGRRKLGDKKTKLPEIIDPKEDPKVIYITSVPSVTLQQIADMFKGKRGYSVANLNKRAREEGWIEARKQWQTRLQAMALDEIAKDKAVQVAKANERHIELGEEIEDAARLALKSAVDSMKEKIEAGEPIDLKMADKLLRTAGSVAKQGVDINRKGMGLADQIVFVKNVREIVVRIVTVLANVLSGHPDLFAVAKDQIMAELVKAEEDIVALNEC